jgi:hypothetical protein
MLDRKRLDTRYPSTLTPTLEQTSWLGFDDRDEACRLSPQVAVGRPTQSVPGLRQSAPTHLLNSPSDLLPRAGLSHGQGGRATSSCHQPTS